MNAAPWTLDQVVFLCKHYKTMQAKAIAEKLSEIGPKRTVESVYSKAESMELKRRNVGQFTTAKARALRKAQTIKAPLRDRIKAIIERDTDRTILQLSEETGALRSSCQTICRKLIALHEIHIHDWPSVGKHGAHEAIYRNGPGVSAKRPRNGAERFSHGEIQPIPQPVYPMWHYRVFAPQTQTA